MPDFSEMTIEQIHKWINEQSWGQNSYVRGRAVDQVFSSLLGKIKELKAGSTIGSEGESESDLLSRSESRLGDSDRFE